MNFLRSDMQDYSLTFTWIPRNMNKSGWAISESVNDKNKLKKYLNSFDVELVA